MLDGNWPSGLKGKIVLGSAIILLSTLFAWPVRAELYVGAQAGASFPFDLRNVEGTGTSHGVDVSDLALANTVMYGGKAGYFFDDREWRWVGVELEVFSSTPHVKRQSVSAPGAEATVTALGNGAHVRVLVTALNLIARYPGKRVQPYAGVGLALVHASVSDQMLSLSDSSPGLNLLAGVKGFVTQHLALFAEGKYTFTSFQFEDAGLVGGGIKGVYSAPALVAGVAWHFN